MMILSSLSHLFLPICGEFRNETLEGYCFENWRWGEGGGATEGGKRERRTLFKSLNIYWHDDSPMEWKYALCCLSIMFKPSFDLRTSIEISIRPWILSVIVISISPSCEHLKLMYYLDGFIASHSGFTFHPSQSQILNCTPPFPPYWDLGVRQGFGSFIQMLHFTRNILIH